MEQTIKDFEEREIRYKNTQKKLVDALQLVDHNNKDNETTRKMIVNIDIFFKKNYDKEKKKFLWKISF